MPTQNFAAGDVDYIAKLNELANASLTLAVRAVNFTAVKGYLYALTANNLNVTLPASASQGDRLVVRSGADTVTAVTFLRNGLNINGVAADVSISGGAATDLNVELTYIDATIGWRISRFGSSAPTVVGKQTLWFPAASMTPRVSNGAAPGLVELATNKIMLSTLDFDPATLEYAQFAVQMPKQWNESTVSFLAVWSHASTATNFGVVWGLRALALSDDDAMDTAMGTGVTVTDAGGTTNDLYRSAESGAITIGNTPAENDVVIFEVYRDATNGSDTMAIDARLIGIVLFMTTNAAVDN
jgi:hypothetical protein